MILISKVQDLGKFELSPLHIQCSAFMTHPVITLIWILDIQVVAPKFFNMKFYEGIIGNDHGIVIFWTGHFPIIPL